VSEPRLLLATLAAAFLYVVSPGPAFLALFTLATGMAFGLTNPKAYPVALAMFSAIVAPYVGRLGLSDAPPMLGAAFAGFLIADATLIFAAGLPAVRRFFLTHGVAVTRVVGLLFIAFGARSILDAARGVAHRSA
jgi:threonine/homoserine/homoserine lactone efflux protein